MEVEDVLAEFITVSTVGLDASQRVAIVSDRESQALEVFVDGLQEKLRDWAKARVFATLKTAVDFAISEEHNVKPKVKVEPSAGPSQNQVTQNPPQNSKTPPGSKECFGCGQLGH